MTETINKENFSLWTQTNLLETEEIWVQTEEVK